MIELTPDERRGILQEYFRSKAETGVAHVSCPAAAAPPPIDGWDDRTWFLFMPDGRGGYVADYAFIAWAGAHRRLAWVMRIPFTMLLFVLVGLFLHWRIDREVGWLLAGGIFVAGFAGLHLLLSWLYTLPATLRVRKLRYVALPPDLAEQIIRIDGSAELVRKAVGGLAGGLGDSAGAVVGALAPKSLGTVAAAVVEETAAGAAEQLADIEVSRQQDGMVSRAVEGGRPTKG